MKKMTSDQVRAAFLQFFAERGHSVQPSSSLVPADDPTLLFVNSGMAPFKNVFLGRETRPYQRAVSTQRCVRAGGKHNDLENVGYTARHHTFFEMLGNFSFGDYFKRDAIHFAWEFLTQTLQIPAEKLWVTVFDDDADAAGIWLEEIKIDPSRFSAIGSCDNFWAMGDVGPCGPCSEIFYDHGESVAGGPPGSADQEGDRYIEIWNLVFMQYNRDANGELHPLPQPSVDTGMGLERISAVLQGVHNNYQIDLFQNLLAAAAKLTSSHDLTDSSLRVIADHIRASAFMIMDGVLPANEGRGYVLRRIIRRAVRHGYRLGVADIFFYKLVAPLAQQMGSVFPEIKQTQDKIEQVLQAEEQRFGETLQQGMKILESHLAQLDGTVISGDIVFLLYDTYGFPLDLTADFAREHQLTVDRQGFEVEMAQQRRRARAAGKFAGDHALAVHCDGVTDFVGYELLGGSATISHLFAQNAPVSQLNCGENGTVILEQTPFYAEGGGQVGDSGTIKIGDGVFAVQDTQKQAGNFLHHGKVASGVITCGKCEVAVDAKRRHATECNHSATHLLHAALRQVLGEHVLQKGSLVDQHKLRFDFAHFAPVSTAQIGEVENIINSQIRLNNPAIAKTMSQAQALATGAMALFGEKYGDEVRVLTIGDFSYELCGGTHVKRTGAIGCLKIIGETGVASGVRRIEALTGQACLDWIAEQNQYLASIGELLKIPAAKTLDKVQQLLAKNKQLTKELQHCHTKLGSNSGGQLADSAVLIDGIKVVAAIVDVGDAKALRSKVDQLKNQLGKVAVVLGAVADDKVILVAGVSKGETGLLSAGELVNFVASKVGGKGGGRADLAQAGGNDPAALDAALLQVPAWVHSRLAAQN